MTTHEDTPKSQADRMTDPTAIAKDWLGRAQADDEVRLDMRRLALAADHQPLADAMRTYVTGAAMADLTPEQKAEVDYARLAADWQALTRRAARLRTTPAASAFPGVHRQSPSRT